MIREIDEIKERWSNQGDVKWQVILADDKRHYHIDSLGLSIADVHIWNQTSKILAEAIAKAPEDIKVLLAHITALEREVEVTKKLLDHEIKTRQAYGSNIQDILSAVQNGNMSMMKAHQLLDGIYGKDLARLRKVEACAKEMYDDYLHNRTILDTDWDLLGEALAEREGERK